MSRYQFDLQRYPSQFSRMKRERWYYLKNEWEQAQFTLFDHEDEQDENEHVKHKEGRWTNAFRRILWWKAKEENDNGMDEKHVQREVDPRLKTVTLDELKQMFLDELYQSQLRWASSSLLEESYVHPRYKRDKWLRFFTQQLPDNYFLMYKPVFHIKQAPIDLDIVLISPSEIYLITLLEGHEHSIFEATSDRFWVENVHQTRKKRLSPLLEITRMHGVVESILAERQFSFPIRRVVISPTSMIDNKMQGVNVDLVDKRTFERWHDNMKRQPSPLKHDQMKVTAILFDYCSPQQMDEEESNTENEML